MELVKHKKQDAKQQDEELHRNLHQGIEHQSQPAFAEVVAGDVALDLALVGAEVGEHEEGAAEQAGPEGVAVVEIGGEVDGVGLAEVAGEDQGIGEAAGDFVQQDDEGGDHSGEDYSDLILLRMRHGIRAADGGVNDRDHAAADDGGREAPAKDGGEHDGGGIDGVTGAQTPLQEKKCGGEEARFFVEAVR